jgi:hypothetical protein
MWHAFIQGKIMMHALLKFVVDLSLKNEIAWFQDEIIPYLG